MNDDVNKKNVGDRKSQAPRSVDAALRTVGLTLSEVLARPGLKALALVGSRATSGLARHDSDWDVLALVDREAFGRSSVGWHGDECQFMDYDPTHPRWLAGDLAGHALAYGVWLCGAPTWTYDDLDHAGAHARALEQFNHATTELAKRWEQFLPSYRRKYARRAGQQLGRALCHRNREPVPPTALLTRRPLDVQPLWELGAVTPDFKRQLLDVLETECVLEPVDFWKRDSP